MRPNPLVGEYLFAHTFGLCELEITTRNRTTGETRTALFSGSTGFRMPEKFDPSLIFRIRGRKIETDELGPLRSGATWCPLVPGDWLPGSLPEVRKGPRDLSFSVRQDVILGPHMVYSGKGPHEKTGILVASSAGHSIPEAARFTIGRATDIAFVANGRRTLSHSGRYIFGGVLGGFGHSLTDGLSRLWFAELEPTTPIVFLNGPTHFLEWALDFLALRNPIHFVRSLEHFDEVVFPVPGISIGSSFLEGHALFLGRAPQDSSPERRVFLSRTRLRSGRGQGASDAAVDHLMQSHEFEVLHPQEMPFESQLQVVRQASLIVGVEGSALHWPLLLKDPVTTRFVAIARHRLGRGVFEHVRRRKHLDWNTLDFRADRTRSLGANAALELDVNQLGQAMLQTENLCGDLSRSPNLVPLDSALSPMSGYWDQLPLFRTTASDAEFSYYFAELMRRGVKFEAHP